MTSVSAGHITNVCLSPNFNLTSILAADTDPLEVWQDIILSACPPTYPAGILAADTDVKEVWQNVCLFVCWFDFLMPLSITRLYRGRVPRLTSDNFTCCHIRDRAEKP